MIFISGFYLLFFIVSAWFFYFGLVFLDGIAASGIIGMTLFSHFVFTGSLRRITFVILRVGVLLFYSTKEVGIDGPSVFLYFWLLFVERFSFPLAYSI